MIETTIIGGTWIGILDLLSFFLIAFWFTKNWKYSIFILTGFLLTQITFVFKFPDAFIEWGLELTGMILMFYFIQKSFEERFV